MESVERINSFLEKVGAEIMTPTEENSKLFTSVLVRGSSATWLARNTEWDFDDLRLRTPLVKMPQQNLLPFYRHLLEHNFDMFGEFTFGVQDNVVFGVETIPHIKSISFENFMERIDIFTQTADRFDDELASRFGAVHIGYTEFGL